MNENNIIKVLVEECGFYKNGFLYVTTVNEAGIAVIVNISDGIEATLNKYELIPSGAKAEYRLVAVKELGEMDLDGVKTLSIEHRNNLLIYWHFERVI